MAVAGNLNIMDYIILHWSSTGGKRWIDVGNHSVILEKIQYGSIISPVVVAHSGCK